MKKLCIDVRGFSEEKKKRVQDAFFKLGYEWIIGGKKIRKLGSDRYGNVLPNGWDVSGITSGIGEMSEAQKPYAVTYDQLMQKSGLDESDPDENCLQHINHRMRDAMEYAATVEYAQEAIRKAFSNKKNAEKGPANGAAESMLVKSSVVTSDDLSDDISSTVHAINQCENDIIETKLLNHLDALLAEQLRRQTK